MSVSLNISVIIIGVVVFVINVSLSSTFRGAQNYNKIIQKIINSFAFF